MSQGSTLILLWSCYALASKTYFSNEDIADVVVDTSRVFSVRCVQIIVVDSTLKGRRQIAAVHKMLAGAANIKISTTRDEDLSLFNRSSIKFACQQNRPLFVILPSNRTTAFVKLKELPTHPRWLVFIDELKLSTQLRDLYVPFDCELMVATRAGADVRLTEFYRVSLGAPLRWERFARWSPLGGLSPPSPPFLYTRRKGLHGLVIKAAIINDVSIVWWQIDPKTNVRKLGGFFGEIWTLLEQLCNFTTEYTEVREGGNEKFGIQLPNGSWTGGIGMVADKTTEFAISDFTITKERAKAVSFLRTLKYTGTHLIIRKPNSKRLEWTNFLAPFSPTLWSAILMTMAILGVTLSCMRSVGCRHGNGEAESMEAVGHVADSLLQVAGLFCQQGLHTTPRATSSRVVFIVASVASVVVLASYSASLISTLTNQKFDLPFTSLEGLADDTRYKIAVLDKILISTLFDGKPNTFDKLKHRYYSEFPAREKICSEHLAFVGTQLSANESFLRSLPCDVVTLDENILMQHCTIVADKESHYRGLFNYYLTRLRDAGIIKQHLLSFWPRVASVNDVDAALVFVDLAQVLPALATLTAGLVLGVMILLVEHLKVQRPSQDQHVV